MGISYGIKLVEMANGFYGNNLDENPLGRKDVQN